MIVSEALKYVFVSIPKCGSQTLFQVLPSRYQGHRVGGMHHNRIPKHAEKFFCFTVVRHPCDRMVSIWWSTTQRPERKSDDRYGLRATASNSGFNPDVFEEWAAAMISAPVQRDASILLRSQSDQIRSCRIDKMLRLESLEAEFRCLPFVRDPTIHLPRLNATQTPRQAWEVQKSASLRPQTGPVVEIEPRKPYTAYVTDAAKSLIVDHYAQDFELGGYEP